MQSIYILKISTDGDSNVNVGCQAMDVGAQLAKF
jgi:hypothetical protein